MNVDIAGVVEKSLAGIQPPLAAVNEFIAHPKPVYFAKPCASFGYYRGNPIYCGDGANEGPNSQGVEEFALGQGPTTTSGIDVPLGVIIPLALVVALLFAFLCHG